MTRRHPARLVALDRGQQRLVRFNGALKRPRQQRNRDRREVIAGEKDSLVEEDEADALATVTRSIDDRDAEGAQLDLAGLDSPINAQPLERPGDPPLCSGAC